MRNNKNVKIMPDWSGPGLSKTASDNVVQQSAVGKYATVGRWRREACHGQAKEKDGPDDGDESRNSKCGHYTGTWRELAEMMVKRKVDILCAQETKWKGSKARWLQNILPWRRWEEKWSRSYTE